MKKGFCSWGEASRRNRRLTRGKVSVLGDGGRCGIGRNWSVESSEIGPEGRRSDISFDTSEALTITLIGVATAFSLLALLSLFTAFLPRVAGLFSSDEAEQSTEPETTEERNKALAATIAVAVAMRQGHLPEVGGGAGSSPPSESSPIRGEEVRGRLDFSLRRSDDGVKREEGETREGEA